MKTAAGEITSAGVHDAIVPPAALDLAAVARLLLDLDAAKASLGLTRLDALAERGSCERLMFPSDVIITASMAGPDSAASRRVRDVRHCRVEAMTPA
ncbi:hypothetical protein SSBR45G_21620 [Bradyrhizobium sp. SSBR45G]|uniref:hypothetical protein n=1 Tax=unclassified Bradyrhizobium TaxID=2631580 RepID=UPI0023428E8E|nr:MULTISPECIES: hypothetical protein [unclassified Bradyrhizobium]GLH77254.1 hypothetical protein SSBR45G_21620 [Bradyrhizobium sp. SSBR45G]GLH84012.1 hypothetical protein SSBR45R_14720 [Bradyrhizobium sp. SSBR45R]